MLITFYKYIHNQTPYIEKVGFIENFSSANFTKTYNSMGTFKITIPSPSAANIEVVKDSHFVDINGNCGLIDKYVLKQGETEELVVSGYELKALAARRINLDYISYFPFDDYHKPYLIMIHMLQYSLTQCKKVDTGNVIVDDDDRIIKGSISYQTILDNDSMVNYETDKDTYITTNEGLQTIGQLYNIGYYTECNNSENKIKWHLYRGKDRRKSQSTNEPFILSYNLDNINKSEQSSYSAIPNVAFTYFNNAPRITGNDKNLNRYEIYNNTKSCEDLDEATSSNQKKINDYGDKLTYNVSVNDNLIQYYKVNFDVGDQGTIIDDTFGEVDFKISAITEVFENGFMKLQLELNYNKISLTDSIKRISVQANDAVNNSDLVIVKTGNSGAWQYRKWSNGYIEAWATQPVSASGNSIIGFGNDVYYCVYNISSYAIPADVGFTQPPKVYKTLVGNQNVWLSNSNTSISTTAVGASKAYTIIQGTTIYGLNGQLNIYCYGY